jgi:hypothetical protein
MLDDYPPPNSTPIAEQAADDIIPAAKAEHAREMQKWEAAAGTPDTPPAAAPAPAEPSRELTQYAPAYYSARWRSCTTTP